MHIHILGICGTFMGGIALLARQAGHTVSGSDENVYPPMSTQLEEQGIELHHGYHPKNIPDDVEQVVIGNVMSRGNPMVEYVLDKGIAYTSGPQWLADHVLRDRWVLAVAGTHGKTTTASILAWILEDSGLNPGFLIGGIPKNFGVSARFGDAPFFVVEADEYDTAFFDKRSKFIHYRPRTLILNNLEFDHADIFDDLDAIKKQFHHLVRTVPGEGMIIRNGADRNIDAVLESGCWTETESFAVEEAQWTISGLSEDGHRFDVCFEGETSATISWNMNGSHNRMNALASIAAARHAGVPVQSSAEALSRFEGIKRRLEIVDAVNGITLYDDFAHHPTAISETLQAVKELQKDGRLIAVLEPRSNTMRMGVHRDTLLDSLRGADLVFMYQPSNLSWGLSDLVTDDDDVTISDSIDDLIVKISGASKVGDHIVIMSNGGFDGIHMRLVEALREE